MASDALYLPYKVTVSPSSALHPIFGLFYPHKRRHTLCQIRLSPLSLSLGRHGPGQLPNSPHSTVFTGSSRIQAKALSPRSIDDTTRPPNRISDLPPPFRNGAAHSQNPPDSENGLFVPGSTVPRICGRSENASIRECVFDSGMAHSRTVDHSRNGSASQECSGPSGNGRPILRTIRPFPGSSILG